MSKQFTINLGGSSGSTGSIATPVAMNLGGTGQSLAATAGAIVWTDSNSMEVSAAGASGQFLVSNGTSAPTWINGFTLATPLAMSLGGTGQSLAATAGGIVWTDSNSMEVSAAGTSGQFLQSNDGSAPSWATTIPTAAGGTGVTTWVNSQVAFGASGGAGLAQKNTFVFNQATNAVGINTSTPLSALSVNGGLSIGSSYAGSFAAPTNGIITVGAVGIGTTLPAGTLDVNGTIYLNGVNGLSYPSTDSTTNGSVAIGSGALLRQPLLASAAYANTAVGYNTLSGVSMGITAINNTAVGNSSLKNISTGNNNTAIGKQSGGAISTGTNNTAIGGNALPSTTTGDNNTAVGLNSLQTNVVGIRNTGIGVESLYANIGNNNTAFGFQAGNSITSGGSNVVIGYQVATTVLTTGGSNILIGNSNTVTTPLSSTSNYLNIGNTIYGNLSAGAVGIGATLPGASFDVNGTIKIRGGTPGQGKVLQSDSTGVAVWSASLGLDNCGTGASILAAAGAVVYTNASQMQVSAAGTSGQFLQSNGTSAPGWVTGSLAGAWTAFSVTVMATTSAPTYGAGASAIGYYRYVGPKHMQMMVRHTQAAAGTAGTGAYLWKIPNSELIDVTITGASPTATATAIPMGAQVVGYGYMSNTTAGDTQQAVRSIMIVHGATCLAMNGEAGSGPDRSFPASSSNLTNFGSNPFYIGFFAEFPIV